MDILVKICRSPMWKNPRYATDKVHARSIRQNNDTYDLIPKIATRKAKSGAKYHIHKNINIKYYNEYNVHFTVIYR